MGFLSHAVLSDPSVLFRAALCRQDHEEPLGFCSLIAPFPVPSTGIALAVPWDTPAPQSCPVHVPSSPPCSLPCPVLSPGIISLCKHFSYVA